MADADALSEAGLPVPAPNEPARTPTPSPPGPSPAVPGDEKVMSLVDHLSELRDRIVRCALAIAVGGVLGFVLSEAVIRVLFMALPEGTPPLQYFGPGDAFAIRLRISLVIGIILAMPVLLYQLWAFVKPGLTPAERRAVRPWIPLSLAFFALGVVIAWVVLPFAVNFLFWFETPEMQANLSAPAYLDFVSTMFLAFGLLLQFPILLFGLSRVGIVSSARLVRRSPYRDPRHRHLRGGGDTGRRPRQPVHPGRDDVHPLRGHDLLHPSQRSLRAPIDVRRARGRHAGRSPAMTAPTTVNTSSW